MLQTCNSYQMKAENQSYTFHFLVFDLDRKKTENRKKGGKSQKKNKKKMHLRNVQS